MNQHTEQTDTGANQKRHEIMQITTYKDVKEKLVTALETRPVKTVAVQEPIGDKLPEVGDIVEGSVSGAPYPNPRYDTWNFYKMAGRRRNQKDMFNVILNCKIDYYKRFLKFMVFGVTAGVLFFMLPMPYTFAAVPFAGAAIFYWHYTWDSKKNDYEGNQNYAILKALSKDDEYEPYKPPYRIKRLRIWN